MKDAPLRYTAAERWRFPAGVLVRIGWLLQCLLHGQECPQIPVRTCGKQLHNAALIHYVFSDLVGGSDKLKLINFIVFLQIFTHFEFNACNMFQKSTHSTFFSTTLNK